MTFQSQVDSFVAGKQIAGRIHSAISMFIFLEGIKWSTLPVAGGLYDQHPDFVKKMSYMKQEVYKQEAKEEAQRKRESKRGQPTARNA